MTQPNGPKSPLDLPPKIDFTAGKGLGVIAAGVLFILALLVWSIWFSGTEPAPRDAPSWAQPTPSGQEAPAPTMVPEL